MGALVPRAPYSTSFNPSLSTARLISVEMKADRSAYVCSSPKAIPRTPLRSGGEHATLQKLQARLAGESADVDVYFQAQLGELPIRQGRAC